MFPIAPKPSTLQSDGLLWLAGIGTAEHSAPIRAPTESINFVALDRQQQTLGAGAPMPGRAQQQVQRVFAVFGGESSYRGQKGVVIGLRGELLCPASAIPSYCMATQKHHKWLVPR